MPGDVWPAHVYWAAILLVLMTVGPGAISIDALIRAIYRRATLRRCAPLPGMRRRSSEARMNFASDNAAGDRAGDSRRHRAARTTARRSAYGSDAWTRRVEQRFAELFEHEVAVFLVATGTAANALALAHLSAALGRGALPCARRTSRPTNAARRNSSAAASSSSALRARPARSRPRPRSARSTHGQWGGPHHVSPAVLSLSQATEAGTIYRPDEIASSPRSRMRAGSPCMSTARGSATRWRA